MSDEQIYDALNPIFEEVFLRDDIVLTPELNAKDVEGWDSMKQIEIVMAVETEFGFRFHTADLDSLRNVGDLVRVIREKTGKS